MYSEDVLRAKFRRATPEEFVAVREKCDHKAFLTPYTAEEMRNWRHYLTEDGCGFALTPADDLVGLLNNPASKGSGAEAIIWAIHEGARSCDCVAGFLAYWYPMFGFVESHRCHWSDELAPRGWDYERYGRNDVVFFRFPEGLSRGTADTAERFDSARAQDSARGRRDGWLHAERPGADAGRAR